MEIKKNINVGVRTRPLNDSEKERGEALAWDIDTKANTINRKPCRAASKTNNKMRTSFAFDQVYGVSTCTQDIYDRLCRHIVKGGMEGINGTIFAYGQTSSGKTYTIKGTDEDLGILPLAINHLFDYITTSENARSREFLLSVSYLEIYNEKMLDLLRPQTTNLEIKEDRTNGVVVRNLTEQVVCSVEEVLECLLDGERHRHFAETLMNKNSSRSHTIFKIKIESRVKLSTKENGSKRKVRVSCLNFVDLAGSERINQTGAQGSRAAEGMAINKSLMFLGVVIRALADKQKHVPFRDSTLTRILQSSLGGNSQTGLIANISPSESNVEHTINTLRFATRAVKIETNAKVNLVSAERSAMCSNEEKIKALKSRLSMIPEPKKTKTPTKDQTETKKMKKMLALRLQHLQNLILCAETTKANLAFAQAQGAQGSQGKSTRMRSRARRLTTLGFRERERSGGYPLDGPVGSGSGSGSGSSLSVEQQMSFRIESLRTKNKLQDAEMAQLKDDNKQLQNKIDQLTKNVEEKSSIYESQLAYAHGRNLDALRIQDLQALDRTLSEASRRVLVSLSLRLAATEARQEFEKKGKDKWLPLDDPLFESEVMRLVDGTRTVKEEKANESNVDADVDPDIHTESEKDFLNQIETFRVELDEANKQLQIQRASSESLAQQVHVLTQQNSTLKEQLSEKSNHKDEARVQLEDLVRSKDLMINQLKMERAQMSSSLLNLRVHNQSHHGSGSGSISSLTTSLATIGKLRDPKDTNDIRRHAFEDVRNTVVAEEKLPHKRLERVGHRFGISTTTASTDKSPMSSKPLKPSKKLSKVQKLSGYRRPKFMVKKNRKESVKSLFEAAAHQMR